MGVPASFIGIQVAEAGRPSSFQQVGLADDLHAAVLARTADAAYVNAGMAVDMERRISTTLAVARELVDRCERENRLLVAWSAREIIEFDEAVDEALVRRLGDVYRDAKYTAAQWKRMHHPRHVFRRTRWSGRDRLANYLRLIDYQVPSHLGDQKTGKRLRDVRDQLRRKQNVYAKLTPVAKAKWTNLLAHNWHDCNGMRELSVRAAQ